MTNNISWMHRLQNFPLRALRVKSKITQIDCKKGGGEIRACPRFLCSHSTVSSIGGTELTPFFEGGSH